MSVKFASPHLVPFVSRYSFINVHPCRINIIFFSDSVEDASFAICREEEMLLLLLKNIPWNVEKVLVKLDVSGNKRAAKNRNMVVLPLKRYMKELGLQKFYYYNPYQNESTSTTILLCLMPDNE